MDELSEQAREATARLAQGLGPSAAQGAMAWARIEARIEQQMRDDARQRTRLRMRRGWRFAVGYVRRVWKPIAIIAIVFFVARPLLRGDSDGEAHLALARDAMADGDHRRAYNILVDHSRTYRTASAAEARMGLALDCLCALDMHDKAAHDLERYLELNPDSVHASRTSELCPASPARSR